MRKINKVKVVETTQQEFDALKVKFNNIFYWCTDTNKMYKGKDSIGGGDTPTPSGNDFVVTYTESAGEYTADKTFAEMKSAFEAGKNVIAIMSGVGFVFLMNGYTDTVLNFYSIRPLGAKVVLFQIYHDDSDNISVNTYSITPDA